MIGKRSELFRVGSEVDVAQYGVADFDELNRACLYGMGYFGVSNFVAAICGASTRKEAVNTRLLDRVLDGFEGEPFLDRLPLEFSALMCTCFTADENGLVDLWMSIGQFNRFDYAYFESHMPEIVDGVAALCCEAQQQGEVIYFLQQF